MNKSIWQTKSWQEMLKKSNQIEKIIEIDNIFIEKRSLWFGQFWLFILWISNDLDKEVLVKIKDICKKEKALFLQIENLDYWQENFLIIDKNFKKKYYKKFITPFTAVIDLKQKTDEILSKMKPKWRYNIRLAEKKWVEVLEVKKTKENINIFYNLMKETTSRDNFSGNNFSYYKIFLENIEESKLIFADYQGKIISAGIFTYVWKIAIYYYGASTSKKKYRNLMAPYLVQWKAIQIWKEKWCKIYDFLWVASPLEKQSPLAWVTDFKGKFTKDFRQVSESYIFINNKIIYFLFNFLRKIKNLKK